MFKEDLLEIEFLTRQVGSGFDSYMEIPGIGIRGQSLRDINILSDFPMKIGVRNYNINVPEPAVYVIQKITINPHRIPASKREKDIESVRNILPYIFESSRDLAVLENILNSCTKKEMKSIRKVCAENALELYILS